MLSPSPLWVPPDLTARWEGLRHEPRVFPDRLQALIERQAGEEFHPLAGVPQERQVEATVTDVLQPRELGLEARGDRIRAGAGVGAGEVEVRAVPLGREVGQVIEPGVL